MRNTKIVVYLHHKQQNEITMKTQISNLINGCKEVIRNMEDAKYMTAKPATSHIGYAGTNREERNEVAAKVYEENGDTLNITAKGIAITLPIHRSTTGKSWSWSCPLTEEQYVALGGQYTGGTLKSYSLEVLMSCEVVLSSFTRRSEAAQWRSVEPITYLDESFIQIL